MMQIKWDGSKWQIQKYYKLNGTDGVYLNLYLTKNYKNLI